jgi:hypothetical protein
VDTFPVCLCQLTPTLARHKHGHTGKVLFNHMEDMMTESEYIDLKEIVRRRCILLKNFGSSHTTPHQLYTIAKDGIQDAGLSCDQYAKMVSFIAQELGV